MPCVLVTTPLSHVLRCRFQMWRTPSCHVSLCRTPSRRPVRAMARSAGHVDASSFTPCFAVPRMLGPAPPPPVFRYPSCPCGAVVPCPSMPCVILAAPSSYVLVCRACWYRWRRVCYAVQLRASYIAPCPALPCMLAPGGPGHAL